MPPFRASGLQRMKVEPYTATMTESAGVAILHPLFRLDRCDHRRFVRHLRTLDQEDRRARFGVAMRDDRLAHVVANMDFSLGTHLAIPDPKGELIAVVQMGAPSEGAAELALSVSPEWRRKGLAGLLFGEALRRARRARITRFVLVHGHPAILRLAARHRLAVRHRHIEQQTVVEWAPNPHFPPIGDASRREPHAG